MPNLGEVLYSGICWLIVVVAGQNLVKRCDCQLNLSLVKRIWSNGLTVDTSLLFSFSAGDMLAESSRTKCAMRVAAATKSKCCGSIMLSQHLLLVKMFPTFSPSYKIHLGISCRLIQNTFAKCAMSGSMLWQLCLWQSLRPRASSARQLSL